MIGRDIPPEVEIDLKSYLNRTMIDIDNALERTDTLTPHKVLPRKPIVRRLYYFIHPIPPTITEEGVWIYKGGVWKLVA